MVDNSPVSGKIPGGHEASLLNSKKKVEEEVLEPDGLLSLTSVQAVENRCLVAPSVMLTMSKRSTAAMTRLYTSSSIGLE